MVEYSRTISTLLASCARFGEIGFELLKVIGKVGSVAGLQIWVKFAVQSQIMR
jgi:hypothetical protein